MQDVFKWNSNKHVLSFTDTTLKKKQESVCIYFNFQIDISELQY